MENRAYAIATGLFVLLLGAALGLTVWWFSGETKQQDDYLLITHYSVAGLKNQAPVRYRGIDIGKVQDIRLDPANPLEIQIRIGVDRGVPITQGTFGTMGYQGVTGLAYVLLEDRGDKLQRLESKGGELPRIPVKPSFLDTLSDSGEVLLARASEMLDRMNKLLSDKNRASASRAIDNLDTASAELKPALKNAADVAALLKKTFSNENNARINRMLANLEKTSEDAKPLAGEIRQLVASLKNLSERLDTISASTSDEVNGVTLPRAHELMGELIRNSRNLNLLLDEFERNPNAIIFGKPAPRPGPGESGYTE
jgi:phospholipid/cholesterol/gamma-HCH transport system substrate-binding protein